VTLGLALMRAGVGPGRMAKRVVLGMISWQLRFREKKVHKRRLCAPSRAFSTDRDGGRGFRGGSAASSVREVRDTSNRTRFGIRLVDPLLH